MNRKRLTIIAIAATILLVIIIIVLMIVLNQPKATPETPVTNTNTVTIVNTAPTTTVETNTNSDTVVPTNVAPIATDDRQLITAAAISFTERFGSYSSDTNYENIDRSKYLMTDDMKRQADQLVSSSSQASDNFVSVINDVTTSDITDFSSGSTGATVSVSIRQTKTEGTNDPTVGNVNARLTLKKVDGTWKIDSFRYE